MRIFLTLLLLIPSLAYADTSTADVNVSVTIVSIPQPLQEFYGSRFTQGAATISVSRAGFSKIQPLGRAGRNYYFYGVRQGRLFEIAVAVANGRIMQVTGM